MNRCIDCGKHRSRRAKRCRKCANKLTAYTRERRPGHQALKSAIQKRLWANPDYHRKMSEAHKGKMTGAANPRWRGGRRNARGYILVQRPDHPDADRFGYVREHRLVMENALHRRLFPQEFVHHRNGIKNDNRLENLEIMTHSHHSHVHGAKLRHSSITRAGISSKIKASWKNPEHRQRHLEAMARPEYREAMRAAANKRWAKRKNSS